MRGVSVKLATALLTTALVGCSDTGLDGNRVNWYIIPDEKVKQTESLSLIDLAECGAPLSALGIRALWKLCADGLVYNSLEQANSIETEVAKRLASNVGDFDQLEAPDGMTIN